MNEADTRAEVIDKQLEAVGGSPALKLVCVYDVSSTLTMVRFVRVALELAD